MFDLGAVGYGIACLGYLALSLLLLASWEGRGQGMRLVVAATVTLVWAGGLAYLSAEQIPPAPAVLATDALRHVAWIVVLTGLLGTGGFPRFYARAAYAVVSLLGATVALVLLWRPDLFPTMALAAGLLLPLVGLVLLEQVYRNANSNGRWALRYFYVGLGGMFVYDVFLYSQGLLLGGISSDVWFARGFVVVLAVPLIALAAKRNPAWSLNVFVSRDVAFYSASFTVVGLYLLLMAAGGYLVRWLGGSWGYVAQIVFFAGALGVLAALVGSTALRRRLRVFLVKHFYRHKYEYRDEWLRFIATLSATDGDEDPRATGLRAVAQIIASPGAALLMRDGNRGDWSQAGSWPDAVAMLPDTGAAQLGKNHQLLDLLGRKQWVVDIAEYVADRDEYEQLELPAWLGDGPGWRLIVPVLLGDNLFGIMLLKEPVGGFELTFEDRDLLKTVARHIAAHLAQFESERRLAESRQFEAFSRLSAFLMHDLKNAAAQLNLVVSNAAHHKSNPAFVDDVVETVASAAGRITRLIEQLQRGEPSEAHENVPIGELARLAAERGANRAPAPTFEDNAPGLQVRAGRERLASVLDHVIRNAQEATPQLGSVVVRVSVGEGRAVVEVVDSGRGMEPDFVRDRLFRPFDSTKGSKGMGIGAYQVREYAWSLGGDVEVESIPGQGTTFRIILPASALPAVA